MKMINYIRFESPEYPHFGYLDWYWGDSFYIIDENNQEIDVFTVNNVSEIEEAKRIAKEHFEAIKENWQ